MKKTFKSVLSLLLAVLVLVMPVSAQELSGDALYRALNNVSAYIEIHYKFGADADKLKNVAFYEKLTNPDAGLEDMVDAMMSSLDPHSSYLTAEEYRYLLEESLRGEFCGIGVSIIERSGRVVVVSPIKDSPAEKAGVLPNDILAYVNGENVLGKTVEYIQSLIMGEEGTSVNIGFLRGAQTIYLDITRGKIKNESVYYEVNDGIGYLSVSTFNQTTPEGTTKALAEFDKQGVTKIVIDLRNNPGGEINAVMEFAKNFIPKGIIATVEHSLPANSRVYYSDNENPKYKLAVLVNEGSASASELFAAAAKDTEVGKIFGTTSYGKGTMQTIVPYATTGGAIRLTMAEFLSPLGNQINGVGVSPEQTIYNKPSTHDASHLLPYDVTAENKEGDNNNNVKAIEQRLEFLGYFEGVPNCLFDAETAEAVKTYQAYNSLTVTGTTNLETALSLNNIDYGSLLFPDDLQLQAATDYLKSLK